MARRESVTIDMILDTSFALTREEGFFNITARKVAAKVGCSTQPIFRVYKNMEELLAHSGVEDELLLEKTPCFIWSADLEAMEVEKVLNTSDLLPTVLNLMGVDSPYTYIGHDAFDENYDGFVPFSNGSWISNDVAYDAASETLISLAKDAEPVTEEFLARMAYRVSEFIRINNLILETDYYKH